MGRGFLAVAAIPVLRLKYQHRPFLDRNDEELRAPKLRAGVAKPEVTPKT